jgi:hypothetical protein
VEVRKKDGVAVDARAYDAGTEVNSELCDFILGFDVALVFTCYPLLFLSQTAKNIAAGMLKPSIFKAFKVPGLQAILSWYPVSVKSFATKCTIPLSARLSA